MCVVEGRGLEFRHAVLLAHDVGDAHSSSDVNFAVADQARARDKGSTTLEKPIVARISMVNDSLMHA